MPAELDEVRRLMVLPFDVAPGVVADPEPVRRAFIAELVKIQRFEVAPLPGNTREQRTLHETLQHGRISSDALATLGQRYQLDGLLLGTITGYRAYEPPHLGLRVQLLSLHNGKTIWATEAFFDTADAVTQEDLQHYAASFLRDETSLHGYQIVALSPAKYAAYAAHRLVGTWRPDAAATPPR